MANIFVKSINNPAKRAFSGPLLSSLIAILAAKLYQHGCIVRVPPNCVWDAAFWYLQLAYRLLFYAAGRYTADCTQVNYARACYAECQSLGTIEA